jgi:hypothetical protein
VLATAPENAESSVGHVVSLDGDCTVSATTMRELINAPEPR